MAKGKYTKAERSAAAKKGWQGHRQRFWVDRGVKPISNITTGKVVVPIKE